jgi:hypothetical protein
MFSLKGRSFALFINRALEKPEPAPSGVIEAEEPLQPAPTVAAETEEAPEHEDAPPT